MPSPTPQHWRLVRSYDELVREIEAISSLHEKTGFLQFQVETYQEMASSWRKATDPIPGNIPRDRVVEFAELLNCEPDYQAVIDHAYSILYHWPRQLLPHVATLARSLTLLAQEASEHGYSHEFTAADLEQLTDTYFFNVKAVFTDEMKAAPVKRRLAYLEELQEDLIGLVTKGRLIITDPDTGVELPLGDKTQRAFVLEYLRSTLGPMIQECRQEISFEEAGKRIDHRYAYDLDEHILWRESPRRLVRLLELLIEERLIRIPLSAIPSVVHNHFVDETYNRFYPPEISSLIAQPISAGPDFGDSPIPWAGTEGLLAILVSELDDFGFIDCPVDTNENLRYGELIENHFLNRRGAAFKRKQVHNAMQNVKHRNDPFDRVHKILELVRSCT